MANPSGQEIDGGHLLPQGTSARGRAGKPKKAKGSRSSPPATSNPQKFRFSTLNIAGLLNQAATNRVSPPSGSCWLRPIPDPMGVPKNLADPMERNPPDLSGFVPQFKHPGLVFREGDLAHGNSVNRPVDAIQIPDLELATAKLWVVADAA